MKKKLTLSDLDPTTAKRAYKKIEDARANTFFNVLKMADLPLPVREFAFDDGNLLGKLPPSPNDTRKDKGKPRGFKADFAWPEQKVLLELDGGIFGGGRKAKGAHSNPLMILRDIDKSNLAVALGYKPLRVKPDHLYTPHFISLLKIVLKSNA